MEQLKKLFSSLSLRQKVSIAVAAVVVGAALFGISSWRREKDFKPLLTNVAAEDASPVLQKLKEAGVEYRLADGGSTILAPSSKVAELRLDMAAQGLPKTGRIGFELFDKTNLGTTEFAEHINYVRALEGELERSVRCISGVEQARVHITLPKDSVFLESREAGKASVLLTVRQGAHISPQNVAAVTNLVASAVEGVSPERVSVLDQRGNLLSRPKKAGNGEPDSDDAIEYRQKLEKDLLAKISSTLDPLLGPDKFRTAVSIDCDLNSGEQSEETYDPDKTVMLSSQKTEDVSGSGGAAGVPGTASNLPRPAARPSAGGTATTRRTENIVYQPSKTVRRMRLPQATIKRISVALLIDQDVRWVKQGSQWQRTLLPPSAEKLKSIRDLIAGISGITPDRGDQLIVETQPFESTLRSEPPGSDTPAAPGANANPPWAQGILNNKMLVVGIIVGAILLVVAIAAGLILLGRRTSTRHIAVAVDPGAPALPPVDRDQETSARLQNELREQTELQAQERKQLLAEAQAKFNFKPVVTKKAEVLVEHMREEIKKDGAAAAQVLKNWLSENS